MENPWKTHGISLHQFGRHHDFDQIQGVLQPGEPGIIREFSNGSGKPGNIAGNFQKTLKNQGKLP